ncbi:L-threonylcarbamoyladenylate synthase [Chengkuizengella axinellae]|uniref:Threonylcarbamoyl-AMP synthase n=1 Tax=Chengkuizengella axinellae TaxID=3064388 RepID=A0ABT9J5T0_9BACL|nr:L-threonylcarbamoyladenylate synthase [Chengkuizengella sp. 2205SS18-9]MDP5276812.1 L-threonylcarbamoyladenylate synthase [Chengkuizengella sp. 2205SS18-9]
MDTMYWELSEDTKKNNEFIQKAAFEIRKGNVIGFPTETVYGLGADATSTEAVSNIFNAKGRPSDNPLIVHISNKGQLQDLVDSISETTNLIMDRFWPGPLTIIFPIKKDSNLSEKVTAGLDTVAVRMPNHPIALSLIKEAGCPIAAPSANRSGKPSPTEAKHVKEDLDGRIRGLIDGGATGVGIESTVIQIKDDNIYILRPGSITESQLQEITPSVEFSYERENSNQGNTSYDEQTPISPGVKYKHYAPNGSLTIIKGNEEKKVKKCIQIGVNEAIERGEKTGVLTFTENKSEYNADVVLTYGSRNRIDETAHELYAALRLFDEKKVTSIFAEACSEEGMGLAVMNRLKKAAGNQVVQV